MSYPAKPIAADNRSFNYAAVGLALGQANAVRALDRWRPVISCGDGGFIC
jgi:hypothetical protein